MFFQITSCSVLHKHPELTVIAKGYVHAQVVLVLSPFLYQVINSSMLYLVVSAFFDVYVFYDTLQRSIVRKTWYD